MWFIQAVADSTAANGDPIVSVQNTLTLLAGAGIAALGGWLTSRFKKKAK